MVTQDFHETGYTPGWAAPEVFDGGVRSKKTDIFSFAMVMVEVCNRWSPVCWSWLTVLLLQFRYSLVKFLSVGNLLKWLQ
jgi:serine/threonine protein kinase